MFGLREFWFRKGGLAGWLGTSPARPLDIISFFFPVRSGFAPRHTALLMGWYGMGLGHGMGYGDIPMDAASSWMDLPFYECSQADRHCIFDYDLDPIRHTIRISSSYTTMRRPGVLLFLRVTRIISSAGRASQLHHHHTGPCMICLGGAHSFFFSFLFVFPFL